MSLIIGFATQFYTLWDVTENKHYSTVGNKTIHVGTTHVFLFIKNVSKDIDKVKNLYPGVSIDESLRGISRSFERFTKVKIEYSEFQFPYGWLEGSLILESDNVYQLNRILSEDNFNHTPRRKALARRRLIELGELVLVNRSEFPTEDKYVSKGHMKYLVEKKSKIESSGHFFQEGDKVELILRMVNSFSFDTQYGRCYIVTYQDENGRSFYYKGNSVPNISEDFVKIKASIKHGEYKGIKQTFIQRSKIIN